MLCLGRKNNESYVFLDSIAEFMPQPKPAPDKSVYKIGCRFWIKGANGHFMGAGRVQLLENIREAGSITKAAAAMKMSYRQAWQMVEDMNTIAGAPLVEKILGGKGGGGAVITPTGEKAIQLFHELQQEFDHFTEQLNDRILL